MATWIGKAYVTREDLELERAYVRNLRFGLPEPLWRRIACRLLHLRHHEAARLRGTAACSCGRCGHAWKREDDVGQPDGPCDPHAGTARLAFAAALVLACAASVAAPWASLHDAPGRAALAMAVGTLSWLAVAGLLRRNPPSPGSTRTAP